MRVFSSVQGELHDGMSLSWFGRLILNGGNLFFYYYFFFYKR